MYRTDSGTEFTGLRPYFKEKNIYLSLKTGPNKASNIEAKIKNVKRKLYQLMRFNRTDDWTLYFNSVISNINSLPTPFGFIPSEAVDNTTDPEIAALRNETIDKEWNETSMSQMDKNTANAEKRSPLKVGDFVFLKLNPLSGLRKSTDVQVMHFGILF